MKESYGEGPASHTGPEPCVDRREAAGEALTGIHADQPLRAEINPSGVPAPLSEAEGDIGHGAISRAVSGPCGVEDPGYAWKLFAREPGGPVSAHADGAMGRWERAHRRTPDMHADGKSDGPIVPKKLPNNDGPVSSAEVVEGRDRPRGTPGRRPCPRRRAGSPRRSDSMACCIRIRLGASPLFTRGRSRMREICTFGCVRGALGNWRPCRDLST
jgi:hypothetical protein